MWKRSLILAVVVSVGLLFIVGCESDAQTGAALGALAGAGIGQLGGRSTEATLIGAAVGGTAGYIIGNERDKKEYEKQRQAEIEGLRREMNIVSVNITNSNGSVSPVLLRKDGIGYRGPNNEFYDHLPTEEELKPYRLN